MSKEVSTEMQKLIDQMHIITLTSDEVSALKDVLANAEQENNGVSIWRAPEGGVMMDDGTKEKVRICARYEYDENGDEGFIPIK